jgi:flagellar hook assembly protein FlgD
LRVSTKHLENNKQLSAWELQAKQVKAAINYTGFIAQEVEGAAQKLNYDFSGVDKPKNNKDFYGLRYGDFVVPLVKAVQELSQKNEALEAQVAELRQMIMDIKNGRDNTVTSIWGTLEQNMPNPVRGTTIIRYSVPANAASARLDLTNAKGQVVKTVSLGGRGTGQVNLSLQTLAAGTYHYTLYVDGKQVATKRLVITL